MISRHDFNKEKQSTVHCTICVGIKTYVFSPQNYILRTDFKERTISWKPGEILNEKTLRGNFCNASNKYFPQLVRKYVGL